MEIWKAAFGDATQAVDCYGAYIQKDDYGDHEKTRIGSDGKSHTYGWDLDHIRPKSDFKDGNDADFYNNLEPTHFQNNQEKADKYPAFTIGREEYTVVVDQGCTNSGLPGYGIKKKSTGERVDWKWKTNKHFE